MVDELPPSAKNAEKIAIFSSVLILGFILTGILWYFLAPKNDTASTNLPTTTPQLTREPQNTEPITPVPTDINNSVKTYTSQRLPVSFQYSESMGDPFSLSTEKIQVQETGNKIYVYPSTIKAEEGQFVEVFQKSESESLEEAIQRTILINKDPNRCIVTTKNEGNKTIAEITFPSDPNDSLDSLFANTSYCSEAYAQTNGKRYFMEDSSNPEVYVFISIGQYGINVDDTTPWQDTIKITN